MVEDIPVHLRSIAADAVDWFNSEHDSTFELTGVVGADQIHKTDEPFEIGLVLCDGEICACEQVRVSPLTNGNRFSLVVKQAPAIPPLLDPPEGIRSGWLDKVLADHEFVLLLYYRGLW